MDLVEQYHKHKGKHNVTVVFQIKGKTEQHPSTLKFKSGPRRRQLFSIYPSSQGVIYTQNQVCVINYQEEQNSTPVLLG